MENKIALIVGRFQPFHKGHLFLIRKALEKADKIIIGIGSANILDVNNPIDFETRKKIIKAVFYKEGIDEKLVKIVPLDDFFDDQKWMQNLKKQVGKFDIALGNNEWTNNILKKAGYKVLKVNYLKRGLYEGWRIRKLIGNKGKWEDRVPKYLISNIKDQISKIHIKNQKYKHVVLGGTFDRFHLGHKKLLEKAFDIGKKITIGIATEKLYRDKFLSETIEPFEVRKKSVKKFINNYLVDGRIIDIISFSEFTGEADKIKDIDAIVVSKETFPNALRINELRENNKLKPMMIVIIEDVLAEDGKIISSERIRSGEINRKGRVYELPANHQSLTTNHSLKMPESLRPVLQKPLGKIYKSVGAIFKSPKKYTMLIAVGDIIVDSLLKEGIDPDVKVIDFRSRREDYIRSDPFLNSVKKGQTLVNKPGTINLKTAERLRNLIRIAVSFPRKRESRNSWLVVDGEEDLLALPAILFAPLGSLVLYGHWQLGIVGVEVIEEVKIRIVKIISKFIKSI